MHRALFHRPPTGRNKLRPYENNANDNWLNLNVTASLLAISQTP